MFKFCRERPRRVCVDADELERWLDQASQRVKGLPPPPPPRDIPKQRLPYLLRQLCKWLVLPFVLIDHTMQSLARKIVRTPFKKRGKCLKRGNCCHYVLIEYSHRLLGRLFYFWYTQVHGFYLRDQRLHIYEGKLMYVMGCRHLRPDGKCAQYRLRPLMCRQWPLIERFGFPRVLRGCGFYSDPPYPAPRDEDPLSKISHSEKPSPHASEKKATKGPPTPPIPIPEDGGSR